MHISERAKILFLGQVFDYTYIRKIEKKVEKLLDDVEDIGLLGVMAERTEILPILLGVLFEKGIPFMVIPLEMPDGRRENLCQRLSIHYIIKTDAGSGLCLLNNWILSNPPMDFCNVAYCISTSGSTGKPKIIPISRDNLISFMRAISKRLCMEGIIACITYEAFDIFLLETLVPLFEGMTILLSSKDERKNPYALCRMLRENRVDILQITPSQLLLLEKCDAQFAFAKNIRTLLVGGEKFPDDLLARVKSKCKAQIFNAYGPSEATIWSTITDLTKKKCVSIEDTLENTNLILLDETGKKAKIGEIGEICLFGAGVSAGYLDDKEKTKKAFEKIFQNNTEIILYHTGDLARFDGCGRLFFLGRQDNQVKWNGYRIELEEIETQMLTYPGIKCAIAFVHHDVIKVIYNRRKKIAPRDIIIYLKKALPWYMIPNQFIRWKQFKLSDNGKINRKETLDAYFQRRGFWMLFEKLKKFIYKDKVEREVLKIVRRNVDVENRKVNRESMLEEIGITSIIFISIIMEIEEKYKIEFDDAYILCEKYTTILDLIQYVKEKINEKKAIEDV